LNIYNFYKDLFALHGNQGWWPLLRDNPVDGSYSLYHPGNYDIPLDNESRLEICLGAILTQNTSWQNAVKALHNLKTHYLLSAQAISKIELYDLAQLIKPSGYYNQKAKKLQVFCEYYTILRNTKPTRDQLLSLWGIGKETADSMLLYGWKEPVMVIDAYTYRVFKNAGYSFASYDYDALKQTCEHELPHDYTILQEFHALLVKAGKQLEA
jgi:endonuclease III related protein